MSYLFTLTIADVQNFISQAQKIKDLHNGSLIISMLMKNVIKEIENYNGKIIIPQNSESVSNKFVAIFENKTDEDMRQIGKNLEKKINYDFINLIFKETCEYSENLKDFFQVFWVAVELEDNYKSVHQKLEKNLEAVKNLRTFKQQTQSDGKDKCILCGERNQEKDKLCLVCYTKRHCVLDKKQDYPSTAKIAILDWLEGMDYNELKELKDDNSESFDEQWFFEYDKKNKEIKEKFENWLKNHKDILKERKKKKSYALLKFDIDNLGKNLSSLDKGKQKELSKKLGEFSQNIKNFIDNNRGETIYAGGDDFLGFVNLAYLFEVLDEIYCDFENMGFDKVVENLTFSTSIVIAHYKTPLHKVLDYSRELLEEAKDHFDDKNGVGIMVMSSNAVLAKTICRYEDLTLLKEMQKDKIGINLHYKLKSVFDFFDNENMDRTEYENKIFMLEYEIKRLLKRESGNFDIDKYKILIKFLHNQVSGLKTEDSIKIDFNNFIGFLKILEQLRKVL